jgi:ATPase subunit of ABC transporter with duplicated ATPase domains
MNDIYDVSTSAFTNIRLLFTLLFLIVSINGNILKGVLHASRGYKGSVSLFGFRKATTIFDRLSFTIDENATLVALSGPSGSGKSSLAKFILENGNATSGVLIWGADDVQTYYMDQHFYLSYDINKNIEEYILNCTTNSSSSLSTAVLEMLKISSNMPISSLLESQKRGFEGLDNLF